MMAGEEEAAELTESLTTTVFLLNNKYPMTKTGINSATLTVNERFALLLGGKFLFGWLESTIEG